MILTEFNSTSFISGQSQIYHEIPACISLESLFSLFHPLGL